MIKVLFICLGNICRSPMAEFVFKKMVSDAGLEACFHIESAATSREEIGNDIYPPARRMLKERGVPFESRTARQVTAGDVESFDYIVTMDDSNMRNMRRMFGAKAEPKMRMLLSYAGEERSVADPWYTGDFGVTFSDVSKGCEALLEFIVREEGIR